MNIKSFRLFILAAVAIPLCLFCACTGEQKKSGDLPADMSGPLMTLDSQDTIIVDQLATEFIEHLKNQEYDDAISMLYFLTPDSTVVPMPQNMAIRQQQIFMLFPVLDYKFESIRFRTESDCQVKFNIKFFEKTDPEDKRNNTTSLYLQPIRREGQWYLTIRDSSTPAGNASEIEN